MNEDVPRMTPGRKIVAAFMVAGACLFLLHHGQQRYHYPVDVSLELTASTPLDTCQLFYTSNRLGFNEYQSLSQQYQATRAFATLSFRLPPGRIGHVRIDPGKRSDQYEIKKITFRVGDQAITWSGSEILDVFKLVNLELVEAPESEALTLRQAGNPDVQMVFAYSLPEIFRVRDSQSRRRWIAFIAAVGLSGMMLIFLANHALGAGIGAVRKRLSRTIFLHGASARVKAYWSDHKTIILMSFLLAVLAYGYELFNYSLSIDEELYSFSIAKDTTEYFLFGRWGLYFVNRLVTPQSVLPYFPTLLSVVGLAVSSFLFVNSVQADVRAKIVFSVLFITHPIHSYYMAFNIINMQVGLGMMLSVCGYLLYKNAVADRKTRMGLWLLSAFFLASALSLYQAMFSFFIVLGVFHVTRETFSPSNSLRKTFTQSGLFVLVVVLAFLLYKAGDLVTRFLVLGPSSLGKTEYLHTYVGWGAAPGRLILRNLFFKIADYFSGRSYYGGFSVATLLITLPVVVWAVIQRGAPFTKKLLQILLLGVLVFSPFTVLFFTGAPLPVRTLFSFPLLIGMIFLMGHPYASRGLKRLLYAAAIAIFINNTFINTRLFYAGYTSWQADRDMANRIIERIYRLDLPENGGRIRTAFVGIYQHPSNTLFLQSDVFGTSFFSRDDGKSRRLRSFFKTLGIDELDVVPICQVPHLFEQVHDMPSWPQKGSVTLLDDLVVVKFSK